MRRGEMEKDYGWRRGEESEEKVCQALEELKVEGVIKNFGQSLKFSREDISGKDFLITTKDEKIIWIQVKSSFNPVEREKYQRKGIYYLVVGEKTREEIKKEISEILNRVRQKRSKAEIKEILI
jgi:hypothetical protein